MTTAAMGALAIVAPARPRIALLDVRAVRTKLWIGRAAVGVDPLGFRLRHLDDERMQRTAPSPLADKFDLVPKPAPSGRGKIVFLV